MRILTFIILLGFSINGFAQKEAIKDVSDTLAPYEKYPIIPTFSLLTPDSSWFYNTSLDGHKPVLILYFSPDCGHCQLETEELIAKNRELQNLQIVMITSRPFEDMSTFAEHYKLSKFSNIKIGTDPAKRITRFYNVQFTPFSALYNSKGRLVKVYKKGADIDELIKLSQE